MITDRMGEVEPVYIDEVTSRIRYCLMSLRDVLDIIERTHQYENSYIIESLRSVEKDIKNLRKFISV